MKKSAAKKHRVKPIYMLLVIPILTLLLCPRFGWSMKPLPPAAPLTYRSTSCETGAIHIQYGSEEEWVDIAYSNPFSRKFTITVNDTDTYFMNVQIDGGERNGDPNVPSGIGADIVWKDPAGIFYGRYLITAAMAIVCIRLINRAGGQDDPAAKRILWALAGVIYAAAMLISLRVLW